MKREELLVELNSLAWELRNINYIRTAIKALSNPNTKVRCGKRTPKPGGAISVSWQWNTKNLLERYGFFQFEIGNDAPKDGVAGDYIIVFPY